jgi:hypothetical protein
MSTAGQNTRTYTNVALTAIAGLLAVLVVDRVTPPTAAAQPSTVRNQPGAVFAAAPAGDDGDSAGLANALEQRKQMIGELRAISGRLDRIEGALRGGINVKVVDMPPLKLPEGK